MNNIYASVEISGFAKCQGGFGIGTCPFDKDEYDECVSVQRDIPRPECCLAGFINAIRARDENLFAQLRVSDISLPNKGVATKGPLHLPPVKHRKPTNGGSK